MEIGIAQSPSGAVHQLSALLRRHLSALPLLQSPEAGERRDGGRRAGRGPRESERYSAGPAARADGSPAPGPLRPPLSGSARRDPPPASSQERLTLLRVGGFLITAGVVCLILSVLFQGCACALSRSGRRR